MFFALGATDKPEWTESSKNFIESGVKLRTPWTLAFHKKEGHEVGNSLDVAIPFLRAAIFQRLNAPVASTPTTGSGVVSFKSKPPGFSKPSGSATTAPSAKLYKINPQNGWLGNRETYEVATAKDFKGNKASASWLPDEASAKAWQSYLQSGL